MAELAITGNPNRTVHFTTPERPNAAICGIGASAQAWTRIATDADYANTLAVDCVGAPASAPITCGACHYKWRAQHIPGFAQADTLAESNRLVAAKFGEV